MRAKKLLRPGSKGNQRAKKENPKTERVAARVTAETKRQITSYGQADFMAEAIKRELSRRERLRRRCGFP